MSRHAVVTGAAGGIGRAVALRLAAEGWAVAGIDVDPVEGCDAAHRADVSDEAQVGDAFGRISDWCDGRLDLLVNNAGISGPTNGPVEALDLAEWRRRLGVNLDGPFLCTRAAVPLLRAADGAIVNLSSTRARMSEPHCEAYAASKGGIEALTHALAVSLGPSVRVNAIAPGWIYTGDWEGREDRASPDLREIDHDQHPAGRAGDPRDVADAILYLASARFVTGEVLTIDGGMTRKMIYAH